MKKQHNKELPEDFMRDEYDFDYSKGIRGKYARRATEENGYIKLREDIHKIFRTSEDVNNALRAFINAIPEHKNRNAQNL